MINLWSISKIFFDKYLEFGTLAAAIYMCYRQLEDWMLPFIETIFIWLTQGIAVRVKTYVISLL